MDETLDLNIYIYLSIYEMMHIVYGIFDAMMMMIRSINWEIACIACMSVNYIIWVKPAFSMLDQQNIFPSYTSTHIYTRIPYIFCTQIHNLCFEFYSWLFVNDSISTLTRI